MKQKKIIWFAGLLACFVALFGFTRFDDGDIIKKVATALDKWSTDFPQEKVYLHLDKPYYAIGDDIWFKAYITTGSLHKLSAISGILNVELINSNDSLKKAIKLPVTAGQAWGDFKLTDSLKEGNYRVRAYTNWMRNADDAYFFDKTIHIGNSISNNVFTRVSYSYLTQNNQQKVDALISYADIDNKPYTGKEVSYEVQLDNRSVLKGKGITDGSGNLTLSFVNNTPTLLKSGNIVTRIKLDPKQVITKTLPVKSTSAKVDVQFFPEGGYLVEGARSKIAFKAVGADGLGVDVKGIIVDDQNNQLAQIVTQHLGMGAFWLVPDAGKKYTAKLTYPDGSTASVALPDAAKKGYVLGVSNNSNSDDVVVKITLNAATLQENQGAEINLVAQSGGSIVYAAKSKIETAVFATRIPKARFPSGITQFTLFSAKGEALNERIIFIQNPDLLNVLLSTGKQTYAPREKVTLNINSKNKDGKPVVAAFSLAVTDESKVQVDESAESTILSNILLSSDIKGYIEKPNYYFNKVNDETKADLDVLMLTQGYRRFVWKQIMGDNFPPLSFQPEKSIDITGTLKTSGGKPIPHGNVLLMSTTGGMFLMDTLSDEQGKFAFKNLLFADSVKFVIQARNAKGRKNVEIELNNIAPQVITKNKNTGDVEVNINSGMAFYLQNSKKQYDDFLKYGIVSKSTFLKEVSISDKKEPVLKHSDNLNGAGNADQVIKSEQLEACATLTQCLLSQIRFVNFSNGIAYSTRSPRTPMLIIWDGMRMAPDFSLDDIPSADVESVEVLRSGFYLSIYGSGASGGALIVTSKRGGDNRNYKVYAPGIMTYNPIGYHRTRAFYSPKYDDPKTNTKVADLRTTIYWKPNIVTDKNGNTTVEFFNADSPGTYRAVIEGIDDEGNLARQVFRYKVQ